MKLLFVIPCLRKGSPIKYLPVGIGYVMTFVKTHGYDFDVLDVEINEYDDEYVEEYIAKNKYDVILTGSIVTHYKWIKWLTKTIKNYHPTTKVIVGNSVGGSAPEVFLRNSGADAVVIGEGEFGTLDLLNAFRDGQALDGIKGIAFINSQDEFVKTEAREACDVNALPMIDWDLLEYDKYFKKSDASAFGAENDSVEKKIIRTMPVSTARGCVFKCTFCHYVFWDDPYRHRSAESILEEIKRNIDKYGANYINFWDDLSFSSLKQAERIADAIIESGLKFSWSAAVRLDLFGNPHFPYEYRLRVAQKFKDSGCLSVGFSLESGDEEILKMMNKRIKPHYFFEQVNIMREVGITCNNSVVFGYPLETKETIKKTFSMCLEARIYPSIGFLLPLPYTGMYQYAKDNGFIKDEDHYLETITERQDINVNMTKMSDEEILEAIKEGARELNEKLDLQLSESRLIKTGGYRKHTEKTADRKYPLDPDKMKRNENDFSFNYSEAIFEMERGIEEKPLFDPDNC